MRSTFPSHTHIPHNTRRTSCTPCSANSFNPSAGSACVSCGSSASTGLRYCAVVPAAAKPAAYLAFNSSTGVFSFAANNRVVSFDVLNRSSTSVTLPNSASNMAVAFDSANNIGLALTATGPLYTVRLSPAAILASGGSLPFTVTTVQPVAAVDAANQVSYFLVTNATHTTLLGYRSSDFSLFGAFALTPAVLGGFIGSVVAPSAAYTDPNSGVAYFAFPASPASFIVELNLATAFSSALAAAAVRTAFLIAADGAARSVYAAGGIVYVGTAASTVVRLSASAMTRTDASVFRDPVTLVPDGSATSIVPASNGSATFLAVSFTSGSTHTTIYALPGATLDRLGGFPNPASLSSVVVAASDGSGGFFGLAGTQVIRFPVHICAPGEVGISGGACSRCSAGLFTNYSGGLSPGEGELGVGTVTRHSFFAAPPSLPSPILAHRPNLAATFCSSCSPGTFSASGASSCTNCPSGTFQGSSGRA